MSAGAKILQDKQSFVVSMWASGGWSCIWLHGPHIWNQCVFVSVCVCVQRGYFHMWMWEDGLACVCLVHRYCRSEVRKSWWRMLSEAPTYLNQCIFFFFQGDIRLFGVAAIYMIIYSVTDDSLLFSLLLFACFQCGNFTGLYLSSKWYFTPSKNILLK